MVLISLPMLPRQWGVGASVWFLVLVTCVLFVISFLRSISLTSSTVSLFDVGDFYSLLFLSLCFLWVAFALLFLSS